MISSDVDAEAGGKLAAGQCSGHLCADGAVDLDHERLRTLEDEVNRGGSDRPPAERAERRRQSKPPT